MVKRIIFSKYILIKNALKNHENLEIKIIEQGFTVLQVGYACDLK